MKTRILVLISGLARTEHPAWSPVLMLIYSATPKGAPR
nr:hypothetical protein JVH1_4652 [Rhodococcus sp. JVH1]